jgi:hypothetical protein
MNSEQHKEHIENEIKKLKQHIILIEDMLREYRIFNITIKGSYSDNYIYNTKETLHKNWLNLYNKEILNINMTRVLMYRTPRDQPEMIINELIGRCDRIGEDFIILEILIKEKNIKFYENLMELYSDKPDIESIIEVYPEKPEIEKNSIISNELVISSNKTLIALAEAYSKIEEYGTTLDEAYSNINKYEKKLTELYSESKCEKLVIEKNSIIYNELVISSNKTLTALDKAYDKIEKYDTALNDAYSKINKYEIKFSELYSEYKYEKQVIEKKQYSVSASVIFFIMIVFYVITVMTVVLIVNYNYNYNYNYDYDVMHHSMQCRHNTRLIDKHNKLANQDIMIS